MRADILRDAIAAFDKGDLIEAANALEKSAKPKAMGVECRALTPETMKTI